MTGNIGNISCSWFCSITEKIFDVTVQWPETKMLRALKLDSYFKFQSTSFYAMKKGGRSHIIKEMPISCKILSKTVVKITVHYCNRPQGLLNTRCLPEISSAHVCNAEKENISLSQYVLSYTLS